MVCVTAAHAGVEVVFRPPANKAEAAAAKLLRESGVARRTAAFIRDAFALPGTLTLSFGAEDGPLYDPERRSIDMPYSFVDYVQALFTASGEPLEAGELEIITIDVVEHVLYHELGHALIDVFDLPVVGREEDAVDGLATVMLIESFEDGPDMVLSVAFLFSLEDEAGETDESSYWDEHSLDIQRFYDAVCLVYGSDPDDNADVVEELEMDEARLDQCPEDYERQRLSWAKLLRPHLKTPDAFAID